MANLSDIITPTNIVTKTGTETLTNKTLTSPVLTTPALGTPSALVLTNATGTLTSPTFVTPALGTPASGVLTNATGLPPAGVTGTAAILGANTFTALQTQSAGADIASATAVNLTAATGNVVVITGTVTSTSLTMTKGQQMVLIAAAAWPLTFHATTMNITGGVSYTCAAGDRLYVVKDDDDVIRVSVNKQDGTAVVSGGSSLDSTSTGTITAGDPLAILSTGNFEKVSGAISGAGLGATVEFFGTRPDDCVSAYDPVNELTLTIFSQYNSSGKGTYVISRLSGSTLVCDSEVVWEAGNVVNFTLAYHAASGNFLATYTILSSGDTHAIAMDCSSGVVVTGTQVQMTTGSNTFQSGAWSCYDSVEEKVLVTYASGASAYGYAVAIGVTAARVVTVGTAHEFEGSQSISAPRCAYDPVNEKSLCVFKDTTASKFYGIPIDISGATVTSGTKEENATIGNIHTAAGSHVAYCTSQSKFIAAAVEDSGNNLMAAIASLSGGTLAWSGSMTLNSSANYTPFITYDSVLDTVYIVTKISSQGNITTASTDGSTITDLGTEVFCTSINNDVGLVFNSVGRVKEIYYWDQSNNDGDCLTTNDTKTTTATDFIGIAQSSVSTGQPITADTIGGTNDQRTGMTVGAGQYVTYNGGWTEVDTGYVRAGVAISATETHITGAPE